MKESKPKCSCSNMTVSHVSGWWTNLVWSLHTRLVCYPLGLLVYILDSFSSDSNVKLLDLLMSTAPKASEYQVLPYLHHNDSTQEVISREHI